MKNIFKLLTVATALVLMFSSCEDYLEREPVLKNSEDLSLNDLNGINQAVKGAYARLYSGNYYGSDFYIMSDIRAGNAKSSPKNSGRFQEDYNWLQNASSTSNIFTSAYYIITSANKVLERIETYELQANESQEALDHMRAECLFLRALAHHDLVRTYGQPYHTDPDGLGIPIMLKSEVAKPERNTVSEVYAQIVSDLETAIPLFMDGFGSEYRSEAVDPKAYATKPAAQGLLARVALYMRDYDKAANYAGKVIDESDAQLYDASNYTNVWGTNGASEILLEVYGNNQQSYAPYWEEIGYMYDGNGSYADVCASNGLLNMFEASDVRQDLFYSPEGFSGYFWPDKYPGKGGDSRQNNIPVLRLSEMYLIRAEAVLQGASGDALADLNAIRTHRGLTAVSSISMDDIFKERRLELCFEGHIFYDYKRLGRSLDRTDEDNRIVGEEDVPFPSNLWTYPIPQSEMDANENMVQNPGY